MPIAANDLLKKLMVKAGITYDGDLAAIPDDVASSVDNSLLTIAAATNNHPDVKKVYFAQAYNGLDAELKSMYTEFGLAEDVVREIEAAGGSTKKAVALVKKIKELGDKSATPDKEAATKHAAAITELNNKLAAEIKKQTDLEAKFNNDLKGIKVKQKLDSMVGSLKTVYDDLDPVAKEAAITAILNKNLQDSDADFTFDEKGNLSLIKKDGTNLFGDNHTLVTPQSFIDKSLSKILKVTTPGNGKNPPAPPLPGSGQDSKNAVLDAALAESLQSFQQGTKQNGVAV